MKMYVPELGDKIKLVADWSFTLYEEYRNTSLWESQNCKRRIVYPDQAPVVELRALIKEIEDRCTWVENPNAVFWGGRRVRTYASAEDRDNHPKYQYRLAELERRPGTAGVTLSAGTVLKIDRVYIRKGAEDFSSLTFVIESGLALPEEKKTNFKKKIRFWAKLADCNNIEFEKVANEQGS